MLAGVVDKRFSRQKYYSMAASQTLKKVETEMKITKLQCKQQANLSLHVT